MKFLIIGAGAAGSFLGARLIEGGHDVTFLVGPERERLLITRGIDLRTPFGRFRRPVRAITPDRPSGGYGVVMPCVRAQGYVDAMELAAPALGPEIVVVPVVEGIDHLTATVGCASAPIIGAVLDARLAMDADGIVTQRPPMANLTLGAVNDRDAAIAAELVGMIAGRGLASSLCESVRGRAWQRFNFVASAIALVALMGRPYRDCMPRTHLLGLFDKLASEAERIGAAAGFACHNVGPLPNYRRGAALAGVPVQAPVQIADGGRAGAEARHLLAAMVDLSKRTATAAPTFVKAWQRATQDTDSRA